MENQLQLNNTHQNSIALNNKDVELAKIIYHVNQLTAFPLSATQIEDWSISLNELYSELDLSVVSCIIKEFKLDKCEWNPKKGIQNITSALTRKGIFDDETIKNHDQYEQMMYPDKAKMVY